MELGETVVQAARRELEEECHLGQHVSLGKPFFATDAIELRQDINPKTVAVHFGLIHVLATVSSQNSTHARADSDAGLVLISVIYAKHCA